MKMKQRKTQEERLGARKWK
jgi:hypothetical protein